MPSGSRIKEFIEIAHRSGIPAYPSINNFKDPIKIRSWASNFWALGADGVYLFNWYGLKHYGLTKDSEGYRCLSQMGDPEVLHGLDKQYDADNGDSYVWHGFNVQPPQFPVRLINGSSFEVVVGDDVAQRTNSGRRAKVTLRLAIDQMDPSEDVPIIINGHRIHASSIRRTEDYVFESDISVPTVRRGVNRIVVLPGPASMGRLASVVTSATMYVIYHR